MIELWFRKYILSFLVWVFYRLLSASWRVRIVEPEALKLRLKNREPVIFAHWHGDELVLLSTIPGYRIATITSTSKDGELMNSVVRLQRGLTSRGSSTRGAINALKGLIRIVKEKKRNSSFAVDGPKGPLHQVKAGVFELSRLMNAPIYAAGISCSKAWVFKKSWNQTYLPKPFAKIYIEWFGPLGPVTREEDPRSASLRTELEDALRNGRLAALKKIAAPASVS